MLALLISAVLLGGCLAGSASQPETEPALAVATLEAKQQSGYARKRSFVGRVESARNSDLGFELGGLVQRVLVDEGDSVRKGQILAALDTERLRSRRSELVAEKDRQSARLQEMQRGPRREDIEEARATVRTWEARLELADARQRRSKEAFDLDAIAGQEWDDARLGRAQTAQQLEAARQALQELETGTRIEQIEAQMAAVRRLQSQIASLDVDIRKSSLKAPFSGIIAQRHVDEGEVLSPGQSVIRLLENERLEARIGVAAQQARLLDQNPDLELRADGRRLSAQVKAVLPDRQDRTRTVDVVLTLTTPDGLRDGDLVELIIRETVPQKGFWLPISALTESLRGLWAALALVPLQEQPGRYRLERRELEVLASEDDRVFVQGTLRHGELLAASGIHRLAPGQTVRIASDPKSGRSPSDSGHDAQ